RVERHQIDDLLRRIEWRPFIREERAGLRQRLELQHAGHHRLAGEMALEEMLVEGEVLVGVDAVSRDHLHHAIHQEERVAMRQRGQDPQDVHHFPFSFSSFSILCCSLRTSRKRSATRGSAALIRSHSRWSIAGEPLTVSPSGTSCPTPDCAPTRAPSPMRRWPITPTWPARITPWPSSVEPLTPTCATIRQSGPMRTLWPIWTR